MPKGPQDKKSHAQKAHSIFTRLPLRLKALVLCIFILAPVMFVATRFFPPQDRNTILVVCCFALAAIYAFFGLGGANVPKGPSGQ